jgi:hypothetical protein
MDKKELVKETQAKLISAIEQFVGIFKKSIG